MLTSITDPELIDIRVLISVFCFYVLDLVLNLFLKRNKEWILAIYIPFSILFFPVILISDLVILLILWFGAYTKRSILLIRKGFFVRDFINFVLNRTNEPDMSDCLYGQTKSEAPASAIKEREENHQ